MTESVLEQIAVALQTALAAITADNGYESNCLRVVRPQKADAQDYTPEDRLIVLYQDDEEPLADSPDSFHTFTQLFWALVFIMPSDTDTTPFDTIVNAWRADIRKALYADVTLGGLASLLEVGGAFLDKQRTTKATYLAVPIEVQYRTLITNPYSKGD